MSAPPVDWAHVRETATQALRRWSDPWTVAHREDLAQETALAVWQWTQRHEPRALDAATKTIARRLRTRLLRYGLRPWIQPPDHHDSTHAEPLAPASPCQDLADAVSHALASLLRDDADLLLRHHLDLVPLPTLAAEAEMTVGALKTRLARARYRMQRAMEAHGKYRRGVDMSSRPRGEQPARCAPLVVAHPSKPRAAQWHGSAARWSDV